MLAFAKRIGTRSASAGVRRMAAAAASGGTNKRRHMAVTASAGSFFDMSAKSLGSGSRDAPTIGSSVSFSKYAGKVVMVQNVATL